MNGLNYHWIAHFKIVIFILWISSQKIKLKLEIYIYIYIPTCKAKMKGWRQDRIYSVQCRQRTIKNGCNHGNYMKTRMNLLSFIYQQQNKDCYFESDARVTKERRDIILLIIGK